MKHLDEYRLESEIARRVEALRRIATRRWTLMEICGGQTHAIMRFGLDTLFADCVTLVHGPGCPVCVTPVELIDAAIALTRRPDVMLCSFGDMLRVPGGGGDLLAARAAGGDVRTVYSPLAAVRLAQANPAREVVFFAVGFETTAPATAMAVLQAEALGLANFSLLVAHVRVPPAVAMLLAAPGSRIEGLLAPGHVCAITGLADYEALARRFALPVVVTGFEPVDLMDGILSCVRQLESGGARVENAYGRVVRAEGNPAARAAMERVFAVCDRAWRGLGVIGEGGMALSPEYTRYDAAVRFGEAIAGAAGERAARGEASAAGDPCLAGEILQGRRTPHECPSFGRACTPQRPLGAPMVSSEGACAAYYQYRAMAGSDIAR